MDAIVETLVEAGYFRARINGLSDFDKIIGGIAWALQSFSFDIDIDISYADTLDLGQKIALTERLVMVLIAMKCPHPIEPHQIVGLDYSNLLPVIGWLIEKSAEARREHAAFNRLLALRHFHRVTNSLPSRLDWCHVISPTKYKQLKASRQEPGEANEQNSSTYVSRSLELNDSFVPSNHVSFVKLSSLMNVAKCEKDTDEFETTGDVSEPDDNLTSHSLDDRVASTTPDTYKEVINADNLTSEEEEKLHKELNIELLATNQKILNIVKKLDSMPSKMEIAQYQKRYIELHQQLISKNKDLKKIYALFNSLDSTKYYLTKEINLLDSIMENLNQANKSARNRELFLCQFYDIVLQIGSVRDGVTSRLDMMRQKRDKLREEYCNLLN